MLNQLEEIWKTISIFLEMEDDLIFLKMEDDLNFLKMEDNLNFSEILFKMKDNLINNTTKNN